MIKILSRLFSVIFHPLLMPSYGLLILFKSGAFLSVLPSETKMEIERAVYLIVSVSTIFIPLMLIPFFKYFGLIKSIYLAEREERIYPLLMTSVLYFINFYLFKKYIFSYSLQSYMLAISIISFVLFIFSFKLKPSLHMAGLGGATALIFYLSFHTISGMLYPLMFIIFFSGATGSSRIILGAHKPFEVYLGYLVGFSVMFLFMRI